MIRVAIVILIVSALFSPAHALGADSGIDPARTALDLVNRDRAQLGLAPLDGNGGTADVSAPSAQGETIAAGYLTTDSVIKAWLAGSRGRATLLNGLFTDAGVGYVAPGSNTDFETYWALVVAAGDKAPQEFPLPARFAAARADPAVAAPAVVPLPSSFWLLLAALVTGLSLIRRRVDKTKT